MSAVALATRPQSEAAAAFADADSGRHIKILLAPETG